MATFRNPNLCNPPTPQRNRVRLREKTSSVCVKLLVKAVAEMNEKDYKPFSSGEEDETALLAKMKMIMTPPVLMLSLPINYGKLFKDCKRKLIFWWERQHASPMLH